MKKEYIRPQFSCLSLEVENVLSGSDGDNLMIQNEAGTGEDKVQGYNDSDWDEN